MIRTLLTTALLLAPAVASAEQPTCGSYTEFAEELAMRWGESVIERGLSHEGVILEWWGNPETGTWTVLVVRPDGTACTDNFGEGYETFEPIAAGTDS